MGLVHKVRSLWRFDGDTEPILVSRRKFIFIGGVIAAASAVPWAATAFAPEEVWVAYVMSDGGVAALTSYSAQSALSMAEGYARNEAFKFEYWNCEPHVIEIGGQRAFRVWTSDAADPMRAVGHENLAKNQAIFDAYLPEGKPSVPVFDANGRRTLPNGPILY